MPGPNTRLRRQELILYTVWYTVLNGGRRQMHMHFDVMVRRSDCSLGGLEMIWDLIKPI
jgi:hypothetical protein